MFNLSQLSSASIDNEDATIIQRIVEQNHIKTVLEFGPGLSTQLFLELGCHVLSYEHDDRWLGDLREKCHQAEIYEYQNQRDLELPMLHDKRFDLAFVDGPNVHPVEETPPYNRFNTMKVASCRAELILLHDAYRDREQQILQQMAHKGWGITLYPTPRGLAELTATQFSLP